MADLAEVTLVRREVEPGWPIVGDHVPLGRRYLVDLDVIRWATMSNAALGKSLRCAVILVLEPGPPGMLPVMCFGMVCVEGPIGAC